jgi:hypothetical protein
LVLPGRTSERDETVRITGHVNTRDP